MGWSTAVNPRWRHPVRDEIAGTVYEEFLFHYEISLCRVRMCLVKSNELKWHFYPFSFSNMSFSNFFNISFPKYVTIVFLVVPWAVKYHHRIIYSSAFCMTLEIHLSSLISTYGKIWTDSCLLGSHWWFLK